MNFDQARLNMIEQQIRPWEVLNQTVLNLIAEIHREDFIPEEYRQLALADTNIPLAHGQITMTPKVEARLVQSLNIKSGDKILEIGTGCAYLTALLAKSGREVTSVDIYGDFTGQADKKLKRYNINNVNLKTGDAINGWEKASPYDVIVVTGSVPVLEPCFQEQLAAGGRLFVITGESPVMEALLLTRIGNKEWSREVLFETDLPALIGAPQPQRFSL
ncbi:MAG: protein-L-isoaspartate O-methyltransferase [Gammaproteobacteria bacterium]|nr:protein-L-isoaspartate O-methyltransferase [Gammaproteobacteria bacterium]